MALRRYYKEIRYDHYRTFAEVARLRSYASAGRALGLSRPTVWQQIDALEREFGVKLFGRAGRGVEVTTEGRLLLELAQPTVAGFESLAGAFRAQLDNHGGTLRLALIRGNELDAAIARYRQQHPRIQLSLMENESREVIRLVEAGACDLGCALLSPDLAATPPLHTQPIGQRTFTLLTPAQHPLVQKKGLRLADLVRFPLITFLKDSPFRSLIEGCFDRAGLRRKLQVAIEVDRVERAEQCVQSGLGIGIILPPAVHVAPPGLHYRSLAAHFGRVSLQLLWERGRHLLPHVAAFARTVGEMNLQ